MCFVSHIDVTAAEDVCALVVDQREQQAVAEHQVVVEQQSELSQGPVELASEQPGKPRSITPTLKSLQCFS